MRVGVAHADVAGLLRVVRARGLGPRLQLDPPLAGGGKQPAGEHGAKRRPDLRVVGAVPVVFVEADGRVAAAVGAVDLPRVVQGYEGQGVGVWMDCAGFLK